MSLEVFELQIKQSLQRLEEIWQRAEIITSSDLEQPALTSVPSGKELLEESLRELSASMEELRAAIESLKEHNDGLIASRQQIKAERRFYQELFEDSPNCCLITSSNGTIKEANQQAVKLLNVARRYLTNKSLAVFISVAQRREYYTLLKELKSGSISTATWDLDLMPRQKTPLTVNSRVVAIRDSEQNIVNLSWYICVVEAKNISPNLQLGSDLVDSLRNPLYNLNTQLNQITIGASDRAKTTVPPLSNAKICLNSILNSVDNIYILKHFQSTLDLKPFIIDYAESCRRLVRQYQTSNNQQKIIFNCPESCNGICDAFLFEQTVVNLINCISQCSSTHSTIKIKLHSRLQHITVLIISSPKKSLSIALASILAPLHHQRYTNSITSSNLKLLAIGKCITLMQGKIELKSISRAETVVSLTIPSVQLTRKI